MFRRLLPLLLIALVGAGTIHAVPSESLADRTLTQIVQRQKQLLASAEQQGSKLDMEAFRAQAQSIAHDYDLLLADSPNYAAGYAAYGYFLRKIGMSKESIGMLLKANQLDPNLPLVKNEIGNFLAESGKPIEALPYFLAAIKLDPKQPLYHYQLGTLLSSARDTFIKSGDWTPAALDHAMQDAFRRASELSPGDFALAYRYAMSFYEVQDPDWNKALQLWGALEANAKSPIERQTMQLHLANVYLKMGERDKAIGFLKQVNLPALQGQKQRLVVQLNPKPTPLPEGDSSPILAKPVK